MTFSASGSRSVGDGGESGVLGGVQEAQPGWWGCGGVEAVVGFLRGEEGACAGVVVAEAGVTDGEAGVEQRRDAGVLAGVAGLEGGAVDGEGFTVAAFGAGLERQVGPGAGLCVSVLREDSGSEGGGVVES
ncbi:hypothetical protein ACIQWZ_39955 [Streptomyces sp. NPDC098077]|uniref:hypothetical protein n=1 Tax=Streptomyces sp. NPDC098077 TaxID=3366093 RepID=UPI003814005B